MDRKDKDKQLFWLASGAIAAACYLGSVKAHAANSNFIMSASLEGGGDDLRTVHYTNGESYTLRAGQLFSVNGGLIIAPEIGAERYEFQLTIGYKFDAASASNGDVTWSRWPLEALFFNRAEQWRFGGGLAYHLNPSLESTGPALDYTINYNDALGFVVEIDYMFGNQLGLGARATAISYEVANEKTNGNSAGLIFFGRF